MTTWRKRGSKTEYLEFIGSIKNSHFISQTSLASGRIERIRKFSPRTVLLRHDVDKDLDHALELAEYEAKNGISSHYFLLHTASYFDYSVSFKAKIKYLDSLGCGIGLHNDILGVWHNTKQAPSEIIKKPLDYLKSIVDVHLTSCHGYRECYDREYFNYQVFKEWDFAKNEGFDIKWPQINLHQYFLQEVYFSDYTHYWSDSGSNWIGYKVKGQKPFERRALEDPNNMGHNVIRNFNESDTGLLQVLVHPIHWQKV